MKVGGPFGRRRAACGQPPGAGGGRGQSGDGPFREWERANPSFIDGSARAIPRLPTPALEKPVMA